MPRQTMVLTAAALVIAACPLLRAEETAALEYEVRAEAILQKLSPDFCWFHPRATALPGLGKNGQPAVIVTTQKHLAADDHYSGLYFLRSDDLGKTWVGPTEIPELAWRQGPDDATVAVIDVTPGWHASTGKMIAIGAKTLYTKAGAILTNTARSYETSYAVFDPQTNAWTKWRELQMPDTDGKFFRAGSGCSQWLAQPDGSLLVPIQYQSQPGGMYRATVLLCSFDGKELKYLRHGDELSIEGGYGFAEPSLVRRHDKFYLTLRHEQRAYVAASDDGLRFQPVKAWTFDDGRELGSYNTQSHWLAHHDGLFLVYTRRGADNDHIGRNRAPLFIAQVDPQKLHVIRSTEKILLPERGAMLGNFGAAGITADESWVTDAEFISRLVDRDAGKRPHPRGADGTVWLGRVKWSQPNRLVK